VKNISYLLATGKILKSKLDSMRWFSHRRRTGVWHNSRAQGLLPKTLPHFFVFLSLVTLTF